MNQPTIMRKVYDCFLYNGEIDALEIRLQELADVIHRFVVVESDATFSGLPKAPSFNPLDPRIAPFAARVRYVVVKDMPCTDDPWQRETWQRNAILRGIPDATAHDLILLSDVDEIPRATTVQQMVTDDANRIFGLQLAFYYFFVDYRNVAGPESAITWTVAATRAEFEKVSPHDLRHDVRHRRIPARILPGAGWHFSYLTDKAGIREKIGAFSHQEFNNENFLRSIDVLGIVRRRADLFNRPSFRWDIVDAKELPRWLQANPKVLSRLSCPRTPVELLARRLAPKFIRSFPALCRSATAPPVIVCPYVHAHEAAEISAKFGLDKPRGRKLEFFLWQDTSGMGPERAYQHCWEQFPDRDIIILHSDMAPMPDDLSNRWYDALLQYRNRLPCAGMLACNLFYPRATPDEPLRVQCAGGMFCEGQIAHLYGVVQEERHAMKEAVPAAMLRETRAVDWVTFGGVLIRREVIRACGPFDDRYPWGYVMDVDYCFEARLRGFQLFQLPIALQHQESRTTRSFFEKDSHLHQHITRNSQLFYEKWRPFAVALLPSSADANNFLDLRIGEEIFFHSEARGCCFLLDGWSYPEPWGVWSDGSVAKLRFHLNPRPTGEVVVRIRVNAFIPVQSSVRDIEVSIADKLNERWRFDSANPCGQKCLVVDQENIGLDGRLEIGFHVLKPESPAQFGLSTNPRKLGIGLVSLIVDAKDSL
jgi:Glycosyltransferase family 17